LNLFLTKVVVVCSVKLHSTFFEVVIAINSLFFFLSNGSGSVVTLKVTVAQHYNPEIKSWLCTCIL